MNTESTAEGKATAKASDPTDMLVAEFAFTTLRAQGINLGAIEAKVPNCICGQPQAVVFVRQNYQTGQVKFYTMCTEPSRQVCRVSKRLRIHREEYPHLAAATEDEAEATNEALVTAEVLPIHRVTAQEALDSLDGILAGVEAEEAAADAAAAIEAQAIVKASGMTIDDMGI